MKGRNLLSPVGGVEKEYLLLLSPDREDKRRRWTRGHDLVCGRLSDACGESGVDFLASWPSLWKTVRGDGGAWGFEGPSVFEVSTPEVWDGLEAASMLRGYEDSLRRVLADALDRLEQDILLSGSPAYMPRFEPGGNRHTWLGFHLNFFAPLDRRQCLGLASWLAILSPFLSAGAGLTEKGLVLSPAGCRCGGTLGYGQDDRPRLVEIKHAPLLVEDGLERGRFRLHLPCFDAPLSGRSHALSFAAVQVIIGLLLLRECLPDLRLANPGRVLVGISSTPLLSAMNEARRFKLANGRMVTHAVALAAAVGGLEEARRRFRLDPLREMALERIAAGIRAWPGDRERLAEEFDAFRKAGLYRRALELQGVTPAWFDRVAVPVTALAARMGMGLRELAGSSPSEARSLASRGGSEGQRERLRALMREHRLSPADLAGLARAVLRLRSLELRLGEAFPGRSPLRAWEKASWEEFVRRVGPLERPPTQAFARAALVRHFARLGIRVLANWDHFFFFSPDGSIGVIAMPDPERPRTLPFRWMVGEEPWQYDVQLLLEADVVGYLEEFRGEKPDDFKRALADLLGEETVRVLAGECPFFDQLKLF